jgi:hypothetical protein
MCDKITLSQWVFAGQWVLLVDCESGKSAHAQHSSLCVIRIVASHDLCGSDWLGLQFVFLCSR